MPRLVLAFALLGSISGIASGTPLLRNGVDMTLVVPKGRRTAALIVPRADRLVRHQTGGTDRPMFERVSGQRLAGGRQRVALTPGIYRALRGATVVVTRRP